MSLVIADEFSKASLADRLVGAFGRGDGEGAIGWAAGLSLSQNRIGARVVICGACNAVTPACPIRVSRNALRQQLIRARVGETAYTPTSRRMGLMASCG